MGDFNIVRFAEEKIGGRRLNPVMLREFNDCLDFCKLADVRNIGGRWTWNNKSEGRRRIAARLDRILGNPKWFDLFTNAFYELLPTATSDHLPLLLHLQPVLKQYPKPFKFFNYWMLKDEVREVIKLAWTSQVRGVPMFQMVKKLKATKEAIKAWKKTTHGDLQGNIEATRDALAEITSALQGQVSDTELHKKEIRLQKELSGYLFMQESEIRQKSRENWLALGDSNTKFFHLAHRINTAKNSISHLISDTGQSISTEEELRALAPQHFSSAFNKLGSWNIFPRLVVKRKLTNGAAQWLVRGITNGEIKRVVFNLPKDKAPGPDGFGAGFFQDNWELIQKDVYAAIKEFFITGKLLKEVNHTFITLAPKHSSATTLNDYRPIACCNTLYKIIAKLMSNRLKRVIKELISKNQHAFIEGRQIGDCSLLAHELVRDFNKHMGSRACIKVDLKKAFDSVNREFIYFIMHCMGFPRIWIAWIRECLASPTFSIIVNGSPCGLIQSSRGIRQGDPLSPFIFVLVMEYWSIAMDLAIAGKTIEPLKRGSNPIYSHLLFADDMLIFSRANRRSMEGINELFQALELNTGMSINKSKTKVFFSRGVKQRALLCSCLGVEEGSFPVRYLGIPLTPHYLKAQHFSVLLDRCKAKTEGWMAQSLSMGGRVELIRSIIHGMIYYWSLSFKMPTSVIKAMNSLCIKFLWHSKMHVWSWKDICLPKKEGGLGIRRLEDLNKATALRLYWKLANSQGLWAEWMRHRYSVTQEAMAKPTHSGTWKLICSAYDTAQQLQLDTRKLSYSEAWESVRLQGPVMQEYNTIWFPSACPKMSICTLRALLDKLTTRDKLVERGIDTNPICVLCNTQPETSNHLFFICQFSKEVWGACCMILKLNHQPKDLRHELGIIQKQFQEKTRTAILARLAVNATVWHLWKERNSRIFNDTAHNVGIIVGYIVQDCRTLLSHCHWKHTPDPNANHILQLWSV